MKYNKLSLFFIVLILTIVSVNATEVNDNTTIVNNGNYIVQNDLPENEFNEGYSDIYKEIDNIEEIDNDYFYDDSNDIIDDITDIDQNKSATNYPRKVNTQNTNKENITITLKNYTAFAGETITIRATIKTTNNQPLISAKSAFKINGKTQAHLNVTNGTVNYNFKIPQWSAKEYTLTLVVGETSNTNTLSKNSTLTLYKLNTTINTPYLTFAQKNNISYINAVISDQLNRNVYTGKLALKIDDKTIANLNTTNGIINYSFTPIHSIGTHKLTIIYGENTFFNYMKIDVKIRIINNTIHTYTHEQIIEATNRVKNYYNVNKELPNFVVINNNDVTMNDFLYLMCQSLISNNSLCEGNFQSENNIIENITTGKIYKEEYLQIASTITQYIANNGIVPGYVNTSIGNLMLNSIIDGFSRALSFEYNNNRLPNYIAYNKSIYPQQTVNTTDAYLSPSKNCQSNSSTIKNLATQLTINCTTIYTKANAIFLYVRNNIAYRNYNGTEKGALKTLTAKTGNCCDQAHLLVALLRASGIRAGYAHAVCKFNSGRIVGHVWGKIYLNNTWVDADPTSYYNDIGNTASNRVLSWNNRLMSEITF
ncbi:transglutaminase family protein [Methanosphaera sp. WGK6]|uniref:transglutaminase-like domain-containing protein n=1 Tax=Methanosphaera sp. WGK6 TaxID=1561964 RepID=UPI00084CBA24|nr:transglutaminase-like domain-containing protein [Methanosphaera sp. WGK6]